MPTCTTLPVLVSASGSGCELHTVPNCATWSVLVPPVTECVSVVYELVEDYENESYVLLMLIILSNQTKKYKETTPGLLVLEMT